MDRVTKIALASVAAVIVVAKIATDDGDPRAAARTALEEKRKGFHCLSSWDGSHPDMVRLVKDGLRDPKSFEHVETRITPEDQGKHVVFMTYRARNGFGGMNVEKAAGSVDHQTCGAILITAGGL